MTNGFIMLGAQFNMKFAMVPSAGMHSLIVTPALAHQVDPAPSIFLELLHGHSQGLFVPNSISSSHNHYTTFL